jgi:hypothetical protein
MLAACLSVGSIIYFRGGMLNYERGESQKRPSDQINYANFQRIQVDGVESVKWHCVIMRNETSLPPPHVNMSISCRNISLEQVII